MKFQININSQITIMVPQDSYELLDSESFKANLSQRILRVYMLDLSTSTEIGVIGLSAYKTGVRKVDPWALTYCVK